jgi:hypothetical protein
MAQRAMVKLWWAPAIVGLLVSPPGVRAQTLNELEDAIQADLEDLSSSIAELRGKKASDFMDTSLLRELENEGFFARLHAQKTR